MLPKKPLPTLATVARPSACQTVRGGLTDEEVAIAQRLRALRQEERALRQALATADALQRGELEAQLAELRARGRHLTRQREEARHRRMVLLGHEPP
jgi:hypothetical protein